MMNKLLKTLQELSTETNISKSTTSQYFIIGCVKVRVSDHLSSTTNADLNIFCNSVNKHNTYVVVPTIGRFKEIQWFTNIKDLTNFVIQFEKFARILIKNPLVKKTLTEEVDAVDETKLFSLSNKHQHLSIVEWRRTLRNWYIDKRENFEFALDKIFNACKGDVGVIKPIQHNSQRSIEERKKFLVEIYKQLTKNDH